MKQNQTEITNFSGSMANSFSQNMGSGLSQVDMSVMTQGNMPGDVSFTDMPSEQMPGAAFHAFGGDGQPLMPSEFMGDLEGGQMPFTNMPMLSMYLTILQETSEEHLDFEDVMAGFISAGLAGPMGMQGLNGVSQGMDYNDQGMESVQLMGVTAYDDMATLDVM